MGITKDGYINRIRDNLNNLTEETASALFAMGSDQDFIDDNDIFDAIHAYLGSLEVPMSETERKDTIAKISELIENYDKEKETETK